MYLCQGRLKQEQSWYLKTVCSSDIPSRRYLHYYGICKKYNHYNALWAVTFWWCFENEMQRIRIANKCCINTSSHVSRMQEKDIPKGMENYIHNFIELEACNHIPDIKYTSWFLSSNKEHTFLIYLQPYHNLKKCELNYLVFMRWLMVCGDF